MGQYGQLCQKSVREGGVKAGKGWGPNLKHVGVDGWQPVWGPRVGGRRGLPKGGAQNFAFFFSLSRHNFRSFFSLSWGFRGSSVVFEASGP